MIDRDFDSWRSEVIELGRIPQEDDQSVPPSEAEIRFNRYVDLVRQLDGSEGSDAVAALISSMRAENDYGAYQSVHGALALFPAQHLVQGAAKAARALVEIPEEHSGEVLSAVAGADDENVREFNSAIRDVDADTVAKLRDLIAEQETDGWLSDDGLPGRLRV